MARSPFLRLDGTPLGGQTRCEVRIRLHALIRRGAGAAGVWAAMRSPPVSAEEQRCFRARASTPSGKVPSGAIAGPEGSICALRTLHTVLQSGCTGLHSHQQCKRVPLSPRPRQLVFPELWISAAPNCGRWGLTVVLTCVSLMLSDAEHLFMCLVAIRMASSEKQLSRPSARFCQRCHFQTSLYKDPRPASQYPC
uniref:Uncharacterized protein n=1 Tax=Felis catus TaxID=9685 RepID=A0ABI8AT28_FELCA